ncbi:MAG: tetratricopeptide repeat protein [Tepidisphaeraceae bacterium]
MLALRLLLVALCVPATTPARNDDARSIAADGWAMWRNQHYPQAEKAFRRALREDPACDAALCGMGWSRFHVRDYEQAEQYWLKSADVTAFSGLAEMYLLLGSWDQAAVYAEKSFSAARDDFSKELLQAAKHRALSDSLRQRIEPPPFSAGADDAEKGWALYREGKYQDAMDAFRAAMARDAHCVSALCGIGFSLIATGQSPDAKAHFRAALSEDPNSAMAMNGLAQCLNNEGNAADAIELWKELEQRFPADSAAAWGLAFAYLEGGDFAKALPYLERLAKESPDNEHVADSLARAREALGK